MKIENYVEEVGSGPPIIFVHGSYSSPAAWKGMASILAENHRCLLIKLPGHGGTPTPTDFESPTFAPEFEVLDTVFRERCSEPAHLVGHSYGGGVAMAYALRNESCLRALTLFEPGVFWILRGLADSSSAETLDRVCRALRQDILEGVPNACGQIIDFWGGLGSFDALPSPVKGGMAALERENLRHWHLCRRLEAKDDESAYRRLSTPTCLVCGDQSNVIASKIIDALEDRLPRSEKVVIPGASHFLVTTHAELCAAEVERMECQVSPGVGAPINRPFTSSPRERPVPIR